MNDILLFRYPGASEAQIPLAIFDFDGTIVKAKDGRPFPKNLEDWEFTRPSVPTVLKKTAETRHIILVTDQSKPWKVDQIHAVMKVLGLEPSIIIGVKKEHQKPATTLFDSQFPVFDKTQAFYVGDAAGRKGDWSDCDKVFAERLGVRFQVPEQVFPLEPLVFKPIPPIPEGEKEVVIMMGYPASGKSTLAKTLVDYHRVDGDALKTGSAMIKDASKHVGTESIVFDCTASNKKKRAFFVDFAKKHSRSVRIVYVSTPIERAMEQNKQRALEGGADVPDIAFYMFRKHFEMPTEEEGTVIVV